MNLASSPPLQPTDPVRPPTVIVKLRNDVRIPYTDGAEVHLAALPSSGWCSLAANLQHIRIQKLFKSASSASLRRLVDKAARRDPSYKRVNFETYFRVEFTSKADAVSAAAFLMKLPSVQTAYVDANGRDPGVIAKDPLAIQQGYLDPASQGIDARYAWTVAGGDGEGQDLVDIEQGWTLDHQDLVGSPPVATEFAEIPMLGWGYISDASRPHGTMVLTTICGRDNAKGVVGIAPKIRSVSVASYYMSARANAILDSLVDLDNNERLFGAVMLLEAELFESEDGRDFTGLPIELFTAEFDAIRLATALGVTVIEAAGNQKKNLDVVPDVAGNLSLARPGGNDSGAIIVGAATAGTPHSGNVGNYGDRVDCYAWGEEVVAGSSTTAPTFSTNAYTTPPTHFNGTSAASAIIAGVALIVQGIAEKRRGARLSPLQMRALLSDPANGTPSNNPAVDRISVMPDLAKIINRGAIDDVQDVYVRDDVGDSGLPHSLSLGLSPDIIVQNAVVADPQAMFGQGSGTENINELGATISTAQGAQNYIYVRVRNRGASDMADVVAQLWLAGPFSLYDPSEWSYLGSVTIPNVPGGNVLTVSNGLALTAAQIPVAGAYYLVCVVGNAVDLAPDLPKAFNRGTEAAFFRQVNNAAYRDVEVT